MARALNRLGWDVHGVDIQANRPLDVREFFRRSTTRYDLIVHCAAIVGGRATIEGMPLRVAADLAIDADLFQFGLRTKPGRIVYFSSSAAYPVVLQQAPHQRKLTETDIDWSALDAPDQTYGWAKLTGEMLAQHAQAAGLTVHVLRPFSGYGADQSADYPFPAFIARGLVRQDPFTVWGDGTQTRDFIHIDDVVRATLEVLAQGVPGPLNLCTGRPTSFNELVEMVGRAAGYTPALRHVRDAPLGVHYRVGDPTRMLEVYTPRVTLEDGIKQALASIKA
jgi:nucleoside-diphosphate-sugar epimerase